jgi:lipopolysaccharide biosynthesis glycosyltransferase
MTPIVTSCDESFLPGLKALYNSYLQNSQEGFSFHALIYGSRDFADYLENDLAIDVILKPVFPTDNYPTSKQYPNQVPVMWQSLLVPDLFSEYEKSVYIDTDSLILQNLQPLVDVNQGDHVMAATRCNGNIATCYSPTTPSEGRRYGPMTSLMIYNHEPWQRKKMLDRIVETMQRRDITWHMIGQGVLHYVIGRDWQELPWTSQAHAGHDTYFTAPRHEVFTLHFMGTKPWQEFSDPRYSTERKLETRKLWQTYA